MLQNYPITQAEHEFVENWPRVFDEHDVQFLVLDRHDDHHIWISSYRRSEMCIEAKSESVVTYVLSRIFCFHHCSEETH